MPLLFDCDYETLHKAGVNFEEEESTRDVAPQFLSSFEFVSGVGCALLGGWSNGRWRGAFRIAQRERPPRIKGGGELGRCLLADLQVRPRGVVQLSDATPTGPARSASFSIHGILGGGAKSIFTK